MNNTHLAQALDALLPQTQCRQCGHDGCRPYADAIVSGKADINQCPPGGDDGVRALATLSQRDYVPLNTAFGVTKPPAVAVIDEQWCIGCTLCIQACPVDAIAGAAKLMHTVIAGECTGCELCIPPCPVDCIDLVGITRLSSREENATKWKARYESREQRISARRTLKQPTRNTESVAARRKRDALDSALVRAKARIKTNKNN